MKPIYRFSGEAGDFRVETPCEQGVLYFPLVNEQGLMSSIAPDLGGDIKTGQHSFLTEPVSFEDLHLSRATRNFWLTFGGKRAPWSVSGRSAWQRAAKPEPSSLEAGLLWQRVKRKNSALGIEATVLSFVPARDVSCEVMHVEIRNASKKTISFAATSAVPLYGRSADNLRDHRHVTSLLHRLKLEKYGIRLCPTMTFNERGHLINSTSYYVVGADGQGRAPEGVFPTVAGFIGEGGDLERPLALVENRAPSKKIEPTDNGKEAMGALRFKPVTLKPGATASFTLLLGVQGEAALPTPPSPEGVLAWFDETARYWNKKISTVQFQAADPAFNAWVRWVQAQPVLRKLFGCSFLPDFDYGRGGRGWRDLWQDCLALLLQSPEDVREDIVHNYGGVRVDGSNATIIGRRQINGKWFPEFIADRNNIARTWMDHGVWPYLTTLLYYHQTGDAKIFLEPVPYFRDALTHRGKKVDLTWTASARAASGTVIEHILIQTLVQFFNVGEHNAIRLEDADWNDGLDMAHHRGESVAFTNLYGGNLQSISDLISSLAAEKEWQEISVAEELRLLLDRLGSRVDYDSVTAKRKAFDAYMEKAARGFSGKKVAIRTTDLARDLADKAAWIKRAVNEKEWVNEGGHGWYNGYYDENGRRVEGKDNDGRVRVTLSGQVYPVMAGIADNERVRSVVRAVDKYLWDAKLGGVRLNTDFGAIQPQLGRAFSFAFGEKENGAVFSHMAVMYANALYQRGFAADGRRVLNSLFEMAKNSGRSRIFPGLPEYFNNEGRGRYMYLTGSASWFVLTLLTQAFGVRGLRGDLLLAPKLVPAQFDKKGRASVSVRFAGAKVNVTYKNPRRVPYERMKIKNVLAAGKGVEFERISDKEVVLKRTQISSGKEWNLEVEIA